MLITIITILAMPIIAVAAAMFVAKHSFKKTGSKSEAKRS